MKRYPQFSIAALMCVTALLAFWLARKNFSQSPIERYVGIWQVQQGIDNTTYSKAELGASVLVVVDTEGAELVLTSNRLFFVSEINTTGYEILDWSFGTETKLELRPLNSGFKTCAILKREGEKLSFAFVDSKTNHIDESVNGNQIVYTAVLKNRTMQ